MEWERSGAERGSDQKLLQSSLVGFVTLFRIHFGFVLYVEIDGKVDGCTNPT